MHYVWFSQFWSHFLGTMHCSPQRPKSTFFERLKSTFFWKKFLYSGSPSQIFKKRWFWPLRQTLHLKKSIFFQIVPQNDRRLRAIELSVPTVIATFQVKHRNSDGIIVDSRVYNIDLNSGTYLSTCILTTIRTQWGRVVRDRGYY